MSLEGGDLFKRHVNLGSSDTNKFLPGLAHPQLVIRHLGRLAFGREAVGGLRFSAVPGHVPACAALALLHRDCDPHATAVLPQRVEGVERCGVLG